MQTETTFIETVKQQFKYGGVTIKLIYINVGVFLILTILDAFFKLSNLGALTENGLFMSFIGLSKDFMTFITRPWTLLTSIFVHVSFFHLLFNMIFLYFIGRTFSSMFDNRKLLYTFILGGIAGGLAELLAFAIFNNGGSYVIGASGGVMALIVAVAFYRPKLQVKLYGLFSVPIIAIAGVFILKDIIDLAENDGTAHFAHLGGAVFGLLSIQNLHSSNNIVTRFIVLMDRIKVLFKPKPRNKMKAQRGGNNQSYRPGPAQSMTDEEYNLYLKNKQERTNEILDKISKSGYDSLTKKEKEFLFNQSKNG